MNVLFHTATAIGLTVLLTDTEKINKISKSLNIVVLSSILFLLGIFFHGVLDYIPHCYPINSKIDVVLSFIIIIATVIIFKNPFKILIGFSFLGSIIPDVIDLLPSIFNKYFELTSFTDIKIFPWHWKEYSGSVYSENCNVSILNQIFLIFAILIICFYRKKDLKNFI